MFRSTHKGPWRQSTTSCRTRVNPSIRESRRYNGWFYAVGQEIVRWTSPNPLVTLRNPKLHLFMCALYLRDIVTSLNRIVLRFQGVFRALKRREDRLGPRDSRFAKLRNDFFSLPRQSQTAICDCENRAWRARYSELRARVHYVGQFFFRPFARRSLRAALETLKSDSK